MNDAGEKPHSLGLELVRSDDTRQAQQLAVDRDDVFGDVETFSYIPHDRWNPEHMEIVRGSAYMPSI